MTVDCCIYMHLNTKCKANIELPSKLLADLLLFVYRLVITYSRSVLPRHCLLFEDQE